MIRRLEKFIPVLFIILSIFFFKDYFFSHKVPLPFNLLVSFYSPWKYEKQLGYGPTVPNKPLGNDDLRLFYPLKKFSIEEFKAGRVPLWNPYIFSGSVQHATYQSAIFYPLSIVYFFINQVDAWSLLVIIQPILTGLFMYLFLRSLRLSFVSSLFGSLGFAFSGWMIAHWEEDLVIIHSVLWMPLALYASNIIWDTKHKTRGLLILFLSLLFSMLAGFPQIIMYVFGAVFLWNLYKWVSLRKEQCSLVRLTSVIATFVIAILSASIQWVPAFEAYLSAPRANVDSSYLFKTFLSPYSHLITLFVSDFWGNPGTYNYFSNIVYLQERTIYVGIVVIVFALSVFFYKAVGDLRYWKIFTFITYSLGFALPTSWVWYFFRIPILSVAMPIRIFILSTFGICILAAYGLEKYLVDKYYWTNLKRVLYIVFIIFVLLWVFVGTMFLLSKVYPSLVVSCKASSFFWCQLLHNDLAVKQIFSYSSISLRNLLISSLLFISLLFAANIFRNKRRFFIVSIYSLSLFGSYLFAVKILYFSVRKYEYPVVPVIKKLEDISGYDRVWSYGDGYISRNILTYYHIYSPEGYESLFSLRYAQFMNTINTRGVLTGQINRTDATLSEAGQTERMTYNPIRLRLMSILGVKYILEHKKPEADKLLAPTERFPQNLFTLVWQDEEWRIWKYEASLPRSFFVTNVISETDPQKEIDTILNPSTDLLKNVVLEINPNILPKQPKTDDFSTVTIQSYGSHNIQISVHACTDGFLFLSDTFYPGWNAFVDGNKTPIYRADFSFRAVPVNQGEHIVRFTYDPISFKIGIVMSVLGFLSIPLLIIFVRRLIGR